MKKVNRLAVKELRQKTDPKAFKFKTTQDIVGTTEFVGQTRALEAVQFGIGIKGNGYNLYAMGPTGVGKRAVVRSVLESEAILQDAPSDWCYVTNFKEPQKPIALELPPGWGNVLRRDMVALIDELSTSLPILFESDEYITQIKKINDDISAKQTKILQDIGRDAKVEGLGLFPSQQGFVVLPIDEKGVSIPQEEFVKLPDDIRQAKEKKLEDFSHRMEEFLKKIPRLYKERHKKMKIAERAFTLAVVGHSIEKLKKKYENHKDVIEYFRAVQHDVIVNVKNFTKQEEGPTIPFSGGKDFSLSKYQVNVLVDHTGMVGVPVVYEEHPTYSNLICRVEHVAQFGTLSTDFTLIKPGSLHRANGGYLMIDVRRVFLQPFAWEGLKRALYSRLITIEPPERMLGLLSTASIDPMPIPLNVKVILLGDRLSYYLLCSVDPDFTELFKVAVDFEDDIELNKKNVQLYAKLIASLVKKGGLRHFDRNAVAAIIDQCTRLADDKKKLSTHMRSIHDLVRESDYWAGKADHKIVQAMDVERALTGQIHRLDRVRSQLYEQITREIILIDTKNEKVGQINGLSVIDLGTFSFGRPSRITATVHCGRGSVVDIQREVKLGGALHSKGVMILSAFLSSRYNQCEPFSLTANLVFEQTYGMIDGDSASTAELCVLLSALAGVPIKQSFAITGSINQHGIIQAIGGVNEKIEGFFDICKAKGLTGTQGVIIPKANVKHLMLREDVVAAAKVNKFHVYPIENIDQAISLLTGMIAGQRNKSGHFPKGSLNALVEERLHDFSESKKPILRKK